MVRDASDGIWYFDELYDPERLPSRRLSCMFSHRLFCCSDVSGCNSLDEGNGSRPWISSIDKYETRDMWRISLTTGQWLIDEHRI